ncbi:MAG: SdiA-regulated domain-containing protein [Chitinophagaceae bacterium]
MKKFLLITFIILTTYSCNDPSQAKKDVETWTEYDLSEPDRYSMPASLLEISGIALDRENPDTFYAIEDEDGKLYHFGWKDETRKIYSKFWKGGDYEDLAIVRGIVYVLKSNGTIYSFNLIDANYAEVDSVAEWKGLAPPGEYEGMYGDEKEGNLYLLCKNCKGSKQTETVSGYVYKVEKPSEYLLPPVPIGSFELDVESIRPFSGNVKTGFRPSGFARHPITHEWFVISGVNKLLVVAGSDWKVKSAFHLNGNVFNQPEGIAFDTQGNLYISNEGDDITDGNILKFTYKPSR